MTRRQETRLVLLALFCIFIAPGLAEMLGTWLTGAGS